MIRLFRDNWIAIEYQPRDLWIGMYWEHRHCNYYTAIGHVLLETHIWICIVPVFPIKIIHAKLYKQPLPPGEPHA